MQFKMNFKFKSKHLFHLTYSETIYYILFKLHYSFMYLFNNNNNNNNNNKMHLYYYYYYHFLNDYFSAFLFVCCQVVISDHIFMKD